MRRSFPVKRPLTAGYSFPSSRAAVIIKPLPRYQPVRHFSYGYVRYNQLQTENKSLLNETNEAVANQPTSRIGKLIQQSKELVKFYKDGIKLLWSNHKEAKALQLKVQNEGYELSRSEFQLIHRAQKDIIKLIPFGIIFCILPESIPLLVIYVPAMIPSTCLKDSQIVLRQKMTMNVLKSAEQVQGIAPEDFLSLPKFQRIAKHYAYDFDLSRIDRRHLSAYCRFMGLNDYGTQGMLKKRLAKYMDYIEKDDKLLAKEGVDNLDIKELSTAVEERGMRSLNEPEEQMRRALKYWLAVTQNQQSGQIAIPPGLLVFSRIR
ncbi:hypothetical protein RMCBS344292_02910 [Rhizopus microsporus]|nr:hypothetical protein RMCBS344292_02910 [Rhizopus microsporus]